MSDPHPLRGASLKLKQACGHLQAFNRAIDRSRESYPNGIVAEIDTNRGLAAVTIEPDRPRTDIAPILGDLLHNLHCALDHLMWELVRRKLYGSEPPSSTRVTFPIHKNKARFWREGKNGAWASFSGAAALLKIPGDARPLILEVQPYKNGHAADPLWHLYVLSNSDKHQTLHYAQRAVIGGTLHIDAARNAVIRSFEANPGRIYPGRKQEIAKVRFQLTGPDPYFKVHPEFTFTETLTDGPAKDQPITDVAYNIFKRVVNDVFVERFWPYFGADPVEELALIGDYKQADTH